MKMDPNKFLRDVDGRILEVARAMTARAGRPDLVEDAAQEARIAVLEAIGRFDPALGSSRDFAAGCARRAIFKLLRKEKAPGAMLVEDESGQPPERYGEGASPEDLAAGLEEMRARDAERAQIVQVANAAMEPRQARVAILTLVGEATATEIAAEFRISRSTARGLITRAVRRIKGILSGELQPHGAELKPSVIRFNQRRMTIDIEGQAIEDGPAAGMWS